MLQGIWHLSIWGYIGVALLMTHITIASVTIFLHRHQAHRALELHPAISHFFRFWLWLTTGMVTKEWVAVHRKHHAKCETEDDPHSPQVLGIRNVLWRGSELYRAAADQREVLEKYGHGTPEDWLEKHLYTRHSRIGIFLMLLIDVTLFGVIGITIWAVQMMWIPIWAAGVINGIGHYWGYRGYETMDASTNIVPWGILIGGEEMHNNHHAFPSSAKFSTQWWEFDLAWMYIRGLQALGLAKVKKLAPKPVIISGKEHVDMETVRAVIINRFHVMAHYGRDVLLPVLKQELHRADASCRELLQRARGLLVRERSLMDKEAKYKLDVALKTSGALDTVYQFRLRLQEIWSRSTASHENLLRALQEWCTQAEDTGIEVLQNFARTLRGYTLQPA